VRIDKKIQRLQNIDLHAVINDAARDKQGQILRLNKDQMYEEGVMDVTRPGKLKYAPGTIAQKRKKATFKRTDHITLRWFGDFYAKMKIIFFQKEFVITSLDLKWANWLEPQDRFAKALGMTEKSMKRLRQILKLQIVLKLKQQL